jgi:hypothetical protein
MVTVMFRETFAAYFQILILSSCGSLGKGAKVSRLRGSGEVASVGRLRQSSWIRDMAIFDGKVSWLRGYGLLRG